MIRKSQNIPWKVCWKIWKTRAIRKENLTMRDFSGQIELENMAKKFVKLRRKAELTDDIKVREDFEIFKKDCMEKFRPLVLQRASKYKKYPNYEDLEQDGFEALMMALKSYIPEKGSFTWWADKYISTRIARSANAHSTIRFPIKIARELKPHKVSYMPVLVDPDADPMADAFNEERKEIVLEAVKTLPEKHQKLINLLFDLQPHRFKNLSQLLKNLSLSYLDYCQMMQEAKDELRLKLEDSF